jgi:hypothetical protein
VRWVRRCRCGGKVFIPSLSDIPIPCLCFYHGLRLTVVNVV